MQVQFPSTQVEPVAVTAIGGLVCVKGLARGIAHVLLALLVVMTSYRLFIINNSNYVCIITPMCALKGILPLISSSFLWCLATVAK